MRKFLAVTMYVLWIATIIAILTTTFTNFQYEDLNTLAMLLFVFSVLNSFLFASLRNK